MRATHTAFLNDTSELTHGINVISNLISSTNFRENYNQAEIEILDVVKTNIQEFIHDNVAPSVFVTSFSESPDVLSQWRGYADNGRGYCIGFEAKSANSIGLESQNLGFDFFPPMKVFYNNAEFLNFVTDVITNCLNTSPEYNTFGRDAFAESMSSVCWILASLCKHPGFSEENEIRLFFYRTKLSSSEIKPKLQFKSRNSVIIPYVEYDIKQALEIWCGPNQSMFDNEVGLGSFLETLDPDKINILKSKTTFNDPR